MKISMSILTLVLGLLLGAAVQAQATDTDGDGIADDTDNCILVANPDQLDTDGDNFGNLCDTDLNNDCVANFVDLGMFKYSFFSNPATPTWNPDADFDGSNEVNVFDFQVMKTYFFGPPGPSGLPNSCP